MRSLHLKKGFCFHNYLIMKAGLDKEKSEKVNREVKREVNRDGTIDMFLDSVMEHVPTATEDNENFLSLNKAFVERLLSKANISAELVKYSPKICPKCSENLVKWWHKTKNSFLVTLGEIKCVTIPVRYCKKCGILIYPQLYNVGLIPLHHKERIRFYWAKIRDLNV